jgi:hypothetical protein
MQQIADWLEKLGLGQYAQRFAENDISFGILPHLTDQDLKELGVASLGRKSSGSLAILLAIRRAFPVWLFDLDQCRHVMYRLIKIKRAARLIEPFLPLNPRRFSKGDG